MNIIICKSKMLRKSCKYLLVFISQNYSSL
uniref:Uncharacterized protein n=1 Tax=Podoviridae sp. ct8Lf7 TaxID=2827723 RepID=A0A8S5S0N8_9CAUD|nr:MAG TPA: hypothetical protein [Podoviridae sp. ct8Lf7]